MGGYKTVKDLSEEQFKELKQNYIFINDLDKEVSDEFIMKEYDSVEFTDDDFFCSCY